MQRSLCGQLRGDSAGSADFPGGKGRGESGVAAYVAPVAAKQVMVNGKLITRRAGTCQRTVAIAITGYCRRQNCGDCTGNPYLVQNFGAIQTYLCTFSNATTSELSAVKVLFGELQPHGKLPVTLPGLRSEDFPCRRGHHRAAINSDSIRKLHSG